MSQASNKSALPADFTNTTFRQWTQEVSQQLQDIAHDLSILTMTTANLTESLKTHHKIITGNGTPEDGMLFRQTVLEKQVKELLDAKNETETAERKQRKALMGKIVSYGLAALIPAVLVALWLGIKELIKGK
jgi:hypothetical protein